MKLILKCSEQANANSVVSILTYSFNYTHFILFLIYDGPLPPKSCVPFCISGSLLMSSVCSDVEEDDEEEEDLFPDFAYCNIILR